MKDVYFMGVDIGTTGCRAVIFNTDGRVISIASEEYPIEQPQPGWAEQDPRLVFNAVCSSIKKCVIQSNICNKDIVGIGLSSVFHSIIAMDSNGDLLSNALIWADNRSIRQAEYLKELDSKNELYMRTGCRIHPMYPLAKILWFKQERPEIFKRTTKFISLKEYIIYRWFNRMAIDKSVASASGLFNIHTLKWDDTCLDLIGIHENMLGETISTTEVVGKMKGDIATELGLPQDIPVVIGAGDGMLSNLGAGAYKHGQVVAMIGTSGAVRVISDKPLVDPHGRTWCYVLSDKHWVVGGAINNGGIVYRWFRDTLGELEIKEATEKGIDPYELLNKLAGKAKPGCEGLLFLPFLTGERSPYWNPNARGVLFGLGLHHKKPHLVRAIMEGVMYRMYSVFEAIVDLMGEQTEVRATGGFVRSPLWCDIMADIFGYPIKIPEVREASSLGAAILAMLKLGYIDNLDAVEEMVRIKREHTPDPDANKVYIELYNIYKKIYWQLQEQFSQISLFQRNLTLR
ncbi:MAG: gluconokinase [Thermoanaerobacteraceae bacterium]|nr:gluconokinase [Thermoanaerobacteraceae bacterium]